jgi:transcriptional regulator with XRE-family HTH domain
MIKTNPEVLKWLRVMGGLTKKEATEKLGIKEGEIEKWETEEIDFKWYDLEKVSLVYGQPFGWFFLDFVPAFSEPLLHIYGQGAQHDDVFIVGNLEGLEKLYEALGKIMNGEAKQSACEVAVKDGEFYKVGVVYNNDPWFFKIFKDPDTGKVLSPPPEIPEDSKWKNLALPYTEDYAREQDEDAVWPYEIWDEKAEVL